MIGGQLRKLKNLKIKRQYSIQGRILSGFFVDQTLFLSYNCSIQIQMRKKMKAYGHDRHDKIECKYGCCTYKSGKKLNCRKIVDRAHRKTARQIARIESQQIFTTEE